MTYVTAEGLYELSDGIALAFLRDADSRTGTQPIANPSFGVFVAFGDVSRQATGEDQHFAPLAGNVRAEVPGVRAR